MWPAYAKPVQLINNYTEDHSSLGLNQPFLRDKCASKFVRKERLIRHVQTAKNVRGRKSKDAGPAHKAMEEGGNHERKVRLYRLRKYHQVATEEWREGESAGSNMPCYSKPRESMCKPAPVLADLRQQRPPSHAQMCTQNLTPLMKLI